MNENQHNLINCANAFINALSLVDAEKIEYLDFNKLAPSLHETMKLVLNFLEKPEVIILTNDQPQSLKDKIQNVEIQLNEKLAIIEAINAEQFDLFSKEQFIIEKDAEIQEKKTKIANLIHLEAKIIALDTEKFNKEYEEAKASRDILLTSFCEKLSSLLLLLNKEADGLDKIIISNSKAIIDNAEKINSSKKQTIAELSHEIKSMESLFTEYSEEYNSLCKTYSNWVDKLKDICSQLIEIETKHEKNINVFKKHFEDNKILWGSLYERNTAIRFIEEMISEVESRLKDFDDHLFKIIRNKESVVGKELQWLTNQNMKDER